MSLGVNLFAVAIGAVSVGIVYFHPEAALALAFISGVAVTWASRYEVRIISEGGERGTRSDDLEDPR